MFYQLFQNSNPQYFESIGVTMVTLFQLLVGEGWHDIMYSVGEATSHTYAWLFFAYMVVVSVLFTQLFIGIIVEAFEDVRGRLMKGDSERVQQTFYNVLENIGTGHNKDTI